MGIFMLRLKSTPGPEINRSTFQVAIETRKIPRTIIIDSFSISVNDFSERYFNNNLIIFTISVLNFCSPKHEVGMAKIQNNWNHFVCMIIY